MSLWSRVANVFRAEKLNSEIDAELRSHLDEAVAEGRDAREARRAMGSVMRAREESHEARVVAWMDSLKTDIVFGWRQLMKRKVTTAAAVLSLGLAIGACMGAFRLVDALFLRPMPVTHPERLYGVFRQGPGLRDGKPGDAQPSFEYPLFTQMRDAVKDQATVIGVSARLTDVTFGSIAELEKTQLAYVSGSMFGTFGMHATVGRLLTESDDVTPGAHPVAVISYDYWVRRFGRDADVVGRVMHMGDSANEIGDNSYQIVGVGPKGFTGTEPGTVTDIFLPVMMYAGVKNPTWSWIGAFVELKPGVAPEPVHDKIEAVFQAGRHEQAKAFSGRGKVFLDRYFGWHTTLQPVASGISSMQQDYRLPLMVLCILVAMVLLIACANVANLMSAQAAARAKEMALRTALGSGHARLVRLVMVENAMVGAAASGLGMLFAWWASSFVVTRISTASHPVRLVLGADWMVAAIGLALAMGVTLLFGLMPALRVSAVQPVSALKGGEEPSAKQRTMYVLIAAQVAFCFVVLFVSGLFTATFTRLMQRPLGFAAQGVVVIDTTATHSMPATAWDQTAEMLRSAPGVEQVGLSVSALLSGNSFGDFISVNGAANPELAQTLSVAPGWLGAMRIPLVDGRDLSLHDGDPNVPPVALVSKRFATDYFGSTNVIGKVFTPVGSKEPVQVVGVVVDARYQNVREEDAPVFYTPYHGVDGKGVPMLMRNGAFSVRVSGDDPMVLAETLRRMILKAQPEFRIQSVRTEQELIAGQTVKERMLASLAGFFAVVALLLAAIGLYGVLHYSVVQRERELGIRIALGAAAANITRIVTARVFAMVMVGAAVGLGAGMVSARYIQALLYGVKATDASMMVLPAVVLLGAAGLAAAPAVLRAVRIDPARMLRAD